jgi:hypothetical protein
MTNEMWRQRKSGREDEWQTAGMINGRQWPRKYSYYNSKLFLYEFYLEFEYSSTRSLSMIVEPHILMYIGLLFGNRMQSLQQNGT